MIRADSSLFLTLHTAGVAESFPNLFIFFVICRRMAEKYKTSRENQNKNDPNTCSVHEKELGAFCGICREPVCIDCIVGDHKGHPIESVEDVYFKRKV